MSFKSNWSNVAFKTGIYILIFCLDLFIEVSEVLKFPVIILLLLIYAFMYINICFRFFGVPLLSM